ncbi:MAG TPA: lipase maturation factor family protein [Candidatus Limnocylindrales bacterium]|jgi:hypothetical protein|nr:lipase maturation factor family protein [Candidatus Limnocylindrales bacterium]
MPEIAAPDYQLARFLIERGIGAIYLIAFVVALRQFPPLVGEHGLDPATRILRATRFWQTPSLFHWRFSDDLVRAVSWIGIVVSAAIVLGLAARAPLPITLACWIVLWALYLSIVNVGGRFYGFGWETLLLEAGFLAIFLGNAEVPPPWPVILLFRWLTFRVEFGAGLIKLRGDPCWRNLTCMEWHHETQPLANPLSWFFHHLPRPIHRLEAIGNFVAQLILPFGLFLPQPFASVAALLLIGTQLYLVVSGNYAWLNWITIVAAASGLADQVAPDTVRSFLGLGGTTALETPAWFVVAVVGLTVLVIVLSYQPVRNLLSPYQAMNASFEPLHLVNTYGAFGTVGRIRYEVIVEGTEAEELTDDTVWCEYGFKAKPGDPRRVPPQVAPYHLRLDWLMWFLPLSPAYGDGWFLPFLGRLLLGDRAILALLRSNPFPDRPPVHVRARLFRYRFTTWAELRQTGAWWHRTYAGVFVPPLRMRPASLSEDPEGLR